MPRRWSWYNRMKRPESNSLHKLLGQLEVEIMEHLWQRRQATVRDVATAIQEKRPVAYTTVMTVMGHLAEKGLLKRTPVDKRTHLYHVALTRDEFLARASQQMVDALVADFGDLALAHFLEAVEQIEPQRLERLRKRLEGAKAPPGSAAEAEDEGE
jgi:predicted transcriptional regulator